MWITCSNCDIYVDCRCPPLFLNHSTGNPVSRVPRRISFQVICLGMNDQSRATIAEKRVAVIAKSYFLIQNLEPSVAFWVHGEIIHIASVVAVRVLQAVLFSIW